MLLGVLALFCVSLGYGVVVPLLPQLAGVDASSASTIGVVYAAYAAAKIGAQVPGGAWADRAGSTRVLRAALGLYVLSLAGFLLPWGVGWFGAMRVLEGAATGLVYPAVFARVMHVRGARVTGRDLGTVVGLGTSGLLLGPALGALLGAEHPRWAVGAALALGTLCTLWAFLTQDLADRATEPRSVRAETQALWAMARQGAFVAALVPIFFNKLTYSALQGLLPLWGAHGLGLDTRGITALFALTGVGFGVAQPLGGWLADRVSPRTVVLGSGVPVVLALGLLARTVDPVIFTALYTVYVCGTSVIFAATLKHLAVQGAAGSYGGMYGLMGTLTDLATVVGPPFLLGLYGWVEAGVFGAMALLGAAALGIFGWAGGNTSSRASSAAHAHLSGASGRHSRQQDPP